MRAMICIWLAVTTVAVGRDGINFDESKVGNHALPDMKATTADEWTKTRRAEILGLFEDHVFGKTPPLTDKLECKVTATQADALGGLATRKLIHLSLAEHPQWEGMDVLLYIPNGSTPAPCFVGLSFGGNAAVTREKDIPLSTRWVAKTPDHKDHESSRGKESSRWPLEIILKRGFAVATAYYGDVEPDHPEGWKSGIRAALSPDGKATKWANGDWGAIGAWAWGLSRIMDYLQTDPQIDAGHVAVIGHSRLGKTALWAGAQDPRFALVVSNNSGEGGAALMRRDFGETTAVITRTFPHWFTARYAGYGAAPSTCPVDHHMLIALAAPRPVYIASASDDLWADPKGEFLSGVHAGPAYQLFGKPGLGVEVQPPAGKPVGGFIGYHLRQGKHDITAYDWEQYLDFAARHWKRS